MFIFRNLYLTITTVHLKPASRFELRHADADLLQLLESSVPPADVSRIQIFAQPLKRYQEEVWQIKCFKTYLLNACHVISWWGGEGFHSTSRTALRYYHQWIFIFPKKQCLQFGDNSSFKQQKPDWFPSSGFRLSCWTPPGNKRNCSAKTTWWSCKIGAKNLRCSLPSRLRGLTKHETPSKS